MFVKENPWNDYSGVFSRRHYMFHADWEWWQNKDTNGKMLIPHTIQMKDDQHRGTGFFLDREHIRQNIDDIVIINPRFTPAPNLKNDRESHLYRSERGERVRI